jgi:transcriptional regulator with XRE-family HTH domain
MTDIGNEIRRLREERGWTQQDLAYRAGVSNTTMWKTEMGHSTPRLPVLEKFAEALGVDVRDLLPKEAALRLPLEVEEGSNEDFEAYLAGLPLEGLQQLGKDLRDEHVKAVDARDYAKAGELYARRALVGQEIERRDPPLYRVTQRRAQPAEISFYREPTDAELKELEEKYPGYIVVSSPVNA